MSVKQKIAFVICVGALPAGCGSGSVSVVAPPANPTAAASTPVAASPMPSASSAAMPSASPSGGTPAVAPTATATATAASTSAATCPTSTLGNETFTWTLNNSALTITYPPYDTWNVAASIPASSPASTVVTVSDSQNNYDAAPVTASGDPVYATRTRDLYTTFSANKTILFGTSGSMGPIPLTFVSSCVTTGTTYYLDLFENGTFVNSASAAATSGQVVVNMNVIPNPLPSGLVIDAVLSH